MWINGNREYSSLKLAEFLHEKEIRLSWTVKKIEKVSVLEKLNQK